MYTSAPMLYIIYTLYILNTTLIIIYKHWDMYMYIYIY